MSLKQSLLLMSALLFAGLITAEGVRAQAQTGNIPSDERSSFEERRKSILDANNLRATYHNFGFSGRTTDANVDELYFEFPKNTNRRYLYFVSIFTGAEVIDQVTGETIQAVVAPNYRTNPQTGDSWAKNPVVGYFNPDSDEIARSDRGPGSTRGNTWPAFWPDKLDDPSDPGWPNQWNGFFGKDIFNADQEFYYRSGDDQYTRLSAGGSWLPDPEDPSRGGLGLVMDTRILAWTQNLISSVHFNVFEIRNDSRFDYDKVSFMLWTADWVGTPENDLPFFDQERSIAFYTDILPTQSPPEFDGTSIGVAAIRFLETPGNDIDGIDNDGDSDFYLGGGPLFDPGNVDLYSLLTVDGGGFISSRDVLANEVVPQFTAEQFADRQLVPGDPIVLINQEGNRRLFRYPPAAAGDVTVITYDARDVAREVLLPAGGMTVREDTVQARHRNLIDDDLNGLIDENQPNHLTLTRFLPGQSQPVTRPVRFINYLWSGYYEGHAGNPGIDPVGWAEVNGEWVPTDSLVIQRGMIIPDRWVERRIQNDSDFAQLINDYQESLRNLYSRISNPIFPESFFDRYYLNQFTAAPMIDESREDFFDNNQDWRMRDDVGIDGVEDTGSRGEGDGFPSSGAFTPFPGEPNIDKTDVRETDAIGITSATSIPAGSLEFNDGQIWRRYMVPGLFPPAPPATQDTDQMITSSFFQLRAGSIQRFAIAISVAQTGTSTNTADQELVTQQLENAFRAFDANYQFAIAPPPPLLRAVPGDGNVVLYWDDEAEAVFDRFLDRLGVNPRNFEGYRVYRSTDPALADSRRITDGRGNLQFLQPIAQFDLANGITGNHPIDINGLEFYLGNDSGLQRHFVDTDVINGRQYYYVVTAYNSGAAIADIAPSESPVNISINPDGSLTAGQNVQLVIPGGPAAGYTGPAEISVNRIGGTGNATGTIITSIFDPQQLRVNTTYRIEFQDEEITANGQTWRQTTGFNVTDTTNDRIIFEEREEFRGEDLPVFDGVKMIVVNDAFAPSSVAGERPNTRLRMNSWTNRAGTNVPATIRAIRHNGSTSNYRIEFFDTRRNAALTQSSSVPVQVQRGSLTMQAPARDVNFRILNAKTNELVEFGYLPHPAISDAQRGHTGFAAVYRDELRRTDSDLIYIKETNPLTGEKELAWELVLEPFDANAPYAAQPGDVIILNQSSEFTSDDVFEFTINESHIPGIDNQLARNQMENIRVVPNPYIGTHLGEPRPAGADQTRVRQLHFTNLPQQATIRIFSVSGRLVQTLQVNNSIDNGRYIWDMLTKDNLELSYGVYIYHVDAPGVGEKVGKFAVIK
ncbi:MAG: hypothetical protein LAT75_01940 [Candidatus Cyclonatronum sp.]|uniref:T9SS type A sorting domain-containing protein n=1 Tax=Cyclonatronum sp. TaxID=3024185 RepID=UPI0025BA220A|nr:T9SS type A sorting domain-containing protein [Cyclonatronum sp.]MCH8485594.1 hypothetical protein [Cyclonatronum sp.]